MCELSLLSAHRAPEARAARWRSPFPTPHTPGCNGRTPVAWGLLPWWPYLGRSYSHSPLGEAFLPQDTQARVHMHPLRTTAKPAATKVRSGFLSRGWRGGLEEKGGLRPGPRCDSGPRKLVTPRTALGDSQRLQARQLPQRLSGDSSQLVVLQHPRGKEKGL